MNLIDGILFARMPTIVSRHRIVYTTVLAAATIAMALGIGSIVKPILSCYDGSLLAMFPGNPCHKIETLLR